MTFQPYTNQIQGDRHLIQYKEYEDYLDSLVTRQDLNLLRSTVVARTIAEMGYRSTGETLTREQFAKRRHDVMEALFPTRKPYQMCSDRLTLEDPLLQELGYRERANRVGILTTILFIRHYTAQGYEVSGYIDYGARLKTENWLPYFRGEKKIWPRPTDLGFYHWRMGTSACNSSDNFRVIVDPFRGLLYQNKNDRKIVCVDPNIQFPGSNTTRVRVYTPAYEHSILYDHVVRHK